MESGQDLMAYTGYVLAALAVWILARCALSLLRTHRSPEVWGFLELGENRRVPITHWECLLGRGGGSDVTFSEPTVDKTHALLSRNAAGEWTITDLNSGGGVWVGNKRVETAAAVRHGDRLRLGKARARFVLPGESKSRLPEKKNPGGGALPWVTLLLLTLFQILLAFQLAAAMERRYWPSITLSFALLTAAEWGSYFLLRGVGEWGFEPETIAFFLTAVGFAVAASSTPGAMLKQCALLLAALGVFLLLGVWLRDLDRVSALRWVMGAAALGFLGLTLLLSEEIWGAKNWLSVAGNSLQPSEFVKLAYVYAGSAGLGRLLRKRSLLLFVGFSAVIVGALALMGDFGTALVFFVTFLVMAYMRSGSVLLLAAALAAAGAAVTLVLAIRPYVAARFASWGHVWSDPLGAGYQQVRAMSALAAGGLFGRGAGAGWLKNVVAANTDLVFGVVCEELGLIVGLCCVLGVLLLAVFAVRCAAGGRSAYYVMAACAAVTVLLVQMGLNVFGSVDILPFTGVTFPFVSRGGSSLITCWGMLAYVKAADTRPNGSFALGRAVTGKPKARKMTTEKKPADKRPPEKKTAAQKPAGKKPAENKPTQKKPASPKTAGEKKPPVRKSGGEGAGK